MKELAKFARLGVGTLRARFTYIPCTLQGVLRFRLDSPKFHPVRRGTDRGATMVELGLLVPLLFIIFLSTIQIVSYLQAATATQYAAFAAARAYQVYGSKTLGEIGYVNVQSAPYTNASQTAVEAVAEQVLFESLLWEQKKVKVVGGYDSNERYYRDGNDISFDGVGATSNEGSVRVNVKKGLGTTVTYCLPMVFPVVGDLFSMVSEKYPCATSRGGKSRAGIAIQKLAEFGIEPEVPL